MPFSNGDGSPGLWVLWLMDLAQAWCSLFYSWRSQVPRGERTRSHGSFMANPGLIPISLPSPVSFISKTLPQLTVVALLRGVSFWGAFVSLFSLRRDLCRMVISCCPCHLFPPWVDIKTETEVEIATEIEINFLANIQRDEVARLQTPWKQEHI